MLFNGNLAFFQFSMLFNAKLQGGRTDGQMDGRKDVHNFCPCVPLGPLPKKDRREIHDLLLNIFQFSNSMTASPETVSF